MPAGTTCMLLSIPVLPERKTRSPAARDCDFFRVPKLCSEPLWNFAKGFNMEPYYVMLPTTMWSGLSLGIESVDRPAFQVRRSGCRT